MQGAIPVPHGWRELLWYAVAIILASIFGGSFLLGLVAVISLWMSRNKPAAEIHLSEAQAGLAIAQTYETKLKRQKTEGEIIDQMNARLGALALELSQLEGTLRHKDEQIHTLEEQIVMIKAGKIVVRNESTG